MRIIALCFCIGLVIAASSAEAAGLDGLERLYFERPTHVEVSKPIRPYLPDSLRRLHQRPVTWEAGTCYITVEDFPVPAVARGSALVLRQVVRYGDSRIEDLWWALYRDRRRADLWTFFADPMRSGGKWLSNYRLESVHALGAGTVVLLVRGRMDRPGGAWWRVGLSLSCSRVPGGLSYQRVLQKFSIHHDYESPDDTTEAEGNSVDVIVASEVGGHVEERLAEKVPLERLARCGWAETTELSDAGADDEHVPWDVMYAAARCASVGPHTRIRLGKLGEPCFQEVGGESPWGAGVQGKKR